MSVRPPRKRIGGVVHVLIRCTVCGSECYTKAGAQCKRRRYACETCVPLGASKSPQDYRKSWRRSTAGNED